MPTPIRYADSPGGKIAYQTIGEGPIDLVVGVTGAWNLDMAWDNPKIERWLRRLASFSRVILSSARGTAMSDPLPEGITLEDWALDAVYVLDAVGSVRPSYLWYRDIVPMGLLSAAAFPDRTSSIVLVDGYARLTRAPNYPSGVPPHLLEVMDKTLYELWGTGEALRYLGPEFSDDDRLAQWYGRYERATASPAIFKLIRRMLAEVDVRSVLPVIQAPTLVLTHVDDVYIRTAHSRFLAEHLPNAQLVERPGRGDIAWLHDVDGTVAEIQAFLTGGVAVPDLEDRFLATVMFTDIVDSTSRAAELGDAGWRRLLDEHDAVLSRTVESYRGKQIKTTGDGVLATFDGPARAIRCAVAMRSSVARLGLRIRIGLHAGEVEQRQDDIGGIAVAIAARVMAEADADDVLVSSAVPPLVAGSGIDFNDLGKRSLKGVPGEWGVLSVAGSSA